MPLWTNQKKFDTFFAGQSLELVPPDVREGLCIAMLSFISTERCKIIPGSLNSFYNFALQLYYLILHGLICCDLISGQISWTGCGTSQRSATTSSASECSRIFTMDLQVTKCSMKHFYTFARAQSCAFHFFFFFSHSQTFLLNCPTVLYSVLHSVLKSPSGLASHYFKQPPSHSPLSLFLCFPLFCWYSCCLLCRRGSQGRVLISSDACVGVHWFKQQWVRILICSLSLSLLSSSLSIWCLVMHSLQCYVVLVGF